MTHWNLPGEIEDLPPPSSAAKKLSKNMTPGELRTMGTALYGPSFVPSLARDLRVSQSSIDKWLASTRTMPPGIRAELVRIAQSRIAMLEEMTEKLAKKIGNLHGMTRREVSLIGCIFNGEFYAHEDWPKKYTAAMLLSRVRENLTTDAGARVKTEPAEIQRLYTALTRLSDRQARDVLTAARDLDELCPHIIPDD
jgi:urease accessory protein UreF